MSRIVRRMRKFTRLSLGRDSRRNKPLLYRVQRRSYATAWLIVVDKQSFQTTHAVLAYRIEHTLCADWWMRNPSIHSTHGARPHRVERRFCVKRRNVHAAATIRSWSVQTDAAKHRGDGSRQFRVTETRHLGDIDHVRHNVSRTNEHVGSILQLIRFKTSVHDRSK